MKHQKSLLTFLRIELRGNFATFPFRTPIVSRMVDTSPMKPLLKWAGGKRHIASELIALFPPNWTEGHFFEPFFGGGAVFLEIQPAHATISDLNVRLVGFYEQVKNSPRELVKGIRQLAEEFDSLEEEAKVDYFLKLRKNFNGLNPHSIESACHLFALNKLCFNGLYRENSKGEFNVPFGRKRKFPNIEDSDFETVSRALKETKIKNCDFEETVKDATKGDFVYFDPPYVPINQTSSFTSYQSEGFGLEDQKRLAKLLLTLKEKRVNAMCSNSDTKITREIFSKLNIKEINAPRMVSAKSSGRGMIKELVITNY
jgi:DNA adenine methylase